MGIVMETFWHALTKIYYCLRKPTFLLVREWFEVWSSHTMYWSILFWLPGFDSTPSGVYASSSNNFFLLHLFQIFLILGNSLFQNNNNNNLYYIKKKTHFVNQSWCEKTWKSLDHILFLIFERYHNIQQNSREEKIMIIIHYL